jgi:hypothetical protein
MKLNITSSSEVTSIDVKESELQITYGESKMTLKQGPNFTSVDIQQQSQPPISITLSLKP